MIWALLVRNPWLLLWLLLGLAFSVIWYQWGHGQDAQVQIERLEAKISAYESGAALTEKLRQDNARLEQNLHDLKEELRNAEGYDTPLPADIRNTLRKLHP